MRVLRTVTIENSAATKKPLAHTSTSSPASCHRVAASECSMRKCYAFLLLKKCASTKLSMIPWLAASTFSNWMPMPTRRSLHAMRPSPSMSFLDPGVRPPPSDDDQVGLVEIRADPRQQLRGARDDDRLMAGVFHRGAESVPHERRIVRNHDGFRADRGAGHRY